MCPFAKGGKVGLFGGAGVGKTVNMSQVGDELHISYTYQRRAIAHHQFKINLQEETK